MEYIRVFEYKRGNDYSCLITVNEFAGSVVFSKIIVPHNTPKFVKARFLEEAEACVLRQVEQTGGFSGY